MNRTTLAAVAVSFLLSLGSTLSQAKECEPKIYSVNREGGVEIQFSITAEEASPGQGYSSMEFRVLQKRGGGIEVGGIGGCRILGNHQAAANQLLVNSNSGTFDILASCGGNTYPVDAVLHARVDLRSRKVLGLYGEIWIAKYGLPNGWHSGPIKTKTDLVNCGDLPMGSLKSVRAKLNANSQTVVGQPWNNYFR